MTSGLKEPNRSSSRAHQYDGAAPPCLQNSNSVEQQRSKNFTKAQFAQVSE